MDSRDLTFLLSRFPTLDILVVGDYFLDLYLDIDASHKQVSLETGLDVHHVAQQRAYPGAAGTVTSNLRALGVKTRAVGVIGDDGNGYELKRVLAVSGVDTTALLQVRDRVTPTYIKPMRSGHELNRLDLGNRQVLPIEVENTIVDRLRELVPQVNGVIVVDQAQGVDCGVITHRVRDQIGGLAREYPDIVIAAESREHIGLFRDVILQANVGEARRAVGRDDVLACGVELQQRAGRPTIITIGAEGILIFEANGMTRVPAMHVAGPVDTVGAGDSVIAGMTAALCAGAALRQAAEVGNLAAAVTIQQIGVTGTPTPEQLVAANRTVEE